MAVTNMISTSANQAGTHTVKPAAFYDKLLLTMLRQLEFKYGKYAEQKTLPKNYGDTVNWRRFAQLAVNTDALTEGVTPDGLTVSGSEVTAVIAQYGDVLYFTDVVDLLQLDKIRQEYTIELSYLAQEVLDTITRNVLANEGSVYFANGKTAMTGLVTGDVPAIDDFRKIVLGMKKGHIKGNRKAGGKYVALVSPEVMYDLFDEDKVQNYMSYGRTNGMFADGQVVDMFGVRFEEVLNAPELDVDGEAGVVMAYDSIVIGHEAYAITKLEGAGVKIITKGLGSAGTEDALDQRQSIGWKITGFGAKVLTPAAVVNYWSVPGGAEATLEDPLGDYTAEAVD